MKNESPRARLYYLFGSAAGTPSPSPWLARLPVGLFAIPVGLFALIGAWQRAALHGWAPAQAVAAWLLWPACLVWGLILVLYALKCKRHFDAVRAEFRHPVHGSLQALLPLSVLLAVIQLQQPGQGIWLLLAVLALLLHAVIGYRVVAVLSTGQMPRNAVTPALYIPIVGGAMVGAMTLAVLAYPGWAALLFGTGMSGWAVLEARILGSLFEGPLPEPIRLTIGVELAPPVVATLAAAVLWPALPGDVLALGLGIAMVPFVAVAARAGWWAGLPFSTGFWSFSFPLAALAAAVIETVGRGGWPAWIGHAVLLAASAVIAYFTVRTLFLLVGGRLLPPTT